MAHRYPKPGDVKTTDAPRLGEAFQRCLELLMTDLRMEAPYHAFLVRRNIDQLERRAHTWFGTPQQKEHTDALWQALWGIPDPDEVEALASVLREMGVIWPWCAHALLTAEFPRYHSNLRCPSPPLVLGADPQMVPTATAGRRPRDNGAGIRLCVETWYRRKIKHPPDSLQELEREELARSGQQTISRRHSTILQRIDQAERLLELWEVGTYRPPEFYRGGRIP